MQRILVIKLGALGDFVHAFRAFAAIRAHHAADHITLLTTAHFCEVAQIAPWFDAVEVDPRAPWWNLSAISQIARMIGSFDFVYDLQNSRRTRRYFRLAGRPAWSGLASDGANPDADPSYGATHTVERHRQQLQRVGINVFPQPNCDWLIARGNLHTLIPPYALLMPGGAGVGAKKRWPVEGWGVLACHLAQRGIHPVIIGGPNESDIAAVIRDACPASIDLTVGTSIPDFAAIGSMAELAIGNDTGPLHLAAAMGAPTVVLLSEVGTPALVAPRGPNGEWRVILQEPRLSDLSPKRVIAAIDATLAGRFA